VVSDFYDNHEYLVDEVKVYISHNNEHKLQLRQKHEKFDGFETKNENLVIKTEEKNSLPKYRSNQELIVRVYELFTRK
jgi:hypothetical protein